MSNDLSQPLSKTQRLSEERNIDIISNLPVEVLHQIIEFLSTKEAIQTSILSPRWRLLWTSISTIIINDAHSWHILDKQQRTMVGKARMEIVDNVLSQHDTSNSIKKLELSFSVRINFLRLNSWLHSAVRHDVQELNLNLRPESIFTLPNWLFSCHSLVTLNLRLKSILRTPTNITLPNLKKLSLSLIIFFDQVSMQDFLLGCPVLDELSLLDCEWDNVKAVHLCLPTIRKLSIEHLPKWGNLYSEPIKISAVNLTSFDYANDLRLNIKMCNLFSINEASVDFRETIEPLHEVADRITNIITEIYNVEILKMTDETLGCIDLVTPMSDIPTFYNLTQLDLSSGFDIDKTKILMEFLKKTPKLERLSFSEGLDPETYTSPIDLTSESVPSCFSSSLKMFRFSSYQMESDDTDILSFVLRYGTVLESVTICCNFDVSGDDVEEVNKEIKALPRSSKRCVIEVINC